MWRLRLFRPHTCLVPDTVWHLLVPFSTPLFLSLTRHRTSFSLPPFAQLSPQLFLTADSHQRLPTAAMPPPPPSCTHRLPAALHTSPTCGHGRCSYGAGGRSARSGGSGAGSRWALSSSGELGFQRDRSSSNSNELLGPPSPAVVASTARWRRASSYAARTRASNDVDSV